MVNCDTGSVVRRARHVQVRFCLRQLACRSSLNRCRQLSVGPEAALALLIGQMIQEVVYGDPHSTPENPELEAAAIALITTFQVGAGHSSNGGC